MSDPNRFETLVGIFANSPQIPAQHGFPPISTRINAGGGGFEPSIIFELNPAVHITIFRNTWNGREQIGRDILGRYCLHMTVNLAGNLAEHWYRQYVGGGSWDFVGTDNSPYTDRAAKSFEALMGAINGYLFP